MLEILPYAHLSQPVRLELQAAVDQEFGHIPVVQSTQWATPEWAVTLRVQQELATFHHLVERVILLDGRPYRAVGLNNVITLPAFRGQGHSMHLLRTTEPFWWGSCTPNSACSCVPTSWCRFTNVWGGITRGQLFTSRSRPAASSGR